MKFRARRFRINIAQGVLWIFLSFFNLHLYPHQRFYLFIAAVWLILLIDNFFPYAWITDDRLIQRWFFYRRVIFLKDIAVIQSDSVFHHARRGITIHESSGRKTQFTPADPNAFIGFLSARLPDTVIGRSTGAEPPPYARLSDTSCASPPQRLLNPFALLSWVYDSRTNSIHPPSDAN
jgi:hypothetical protein